MADTNGNGGGCDESRDPPEVKFETDPLKLEPLDLDDQVESDLSDSSCSDPGDGDDELPSTDREKRLVVIPEFHRDSWKKDEDVDEDGDEDGEERIKLEPDGQTVLETDFTGVYCIDGRPRTYVCTHCSYSSTHSGHVKRHVMSVHDKVKFPCSLCDYQSTTIYHLKRHMQTRHEEVCFTCDLCKFSSKKRANLKRHYSKSHGQTLNNLTQHTQLPEISVTDVKLCDKCEYVTTDKEDLKHHMKEEHNQTVLLLADQEENGVYLRGKEALSIREEEDGRFSCQQCEYTASLRNSVTRHIRNVHQGLRYPCDQCDYQATRSHHLKRHKDRIHIENVTNI